MKRFIVVRYFETIKSTSLVASFDEVGDAVQYAALCEKGQSGKFFVYEQKFGTEK